MNSPKKPAATAGWSAYLGLRFVPSGSRTNFERTAAEGPLSVQKPFYPEGKPCHVYLLHPPGGVVGGDSLTVDLEVSTGAHALLTTPAATKFYRSTGRHATQIHSFRIDANASLEWLPQEALFFSGCEMRGITRVSLGNNARYIGWETSCLGQPVSDVPFTAGSIDQRHEIYQQLEGQTEPTPLVLERNLWAAGSSALSARWGLDNYTVMGTLFATPFDTDLLTTARTKLTARGLLPPPKEQPAIRTQDRQCTQQSQNREVFGELTLVNGVLIARVLAAGAESAKNWLQAVWQETRPLVMGRTACPPAIWRT